MAVNHNYDFQQLKDEWAKVMAAEKPYQSYTELQLQQEAARRARVMADQQARDAQQISTWREEIEMLTKLETMLAAAIATEKHLLGTEGMGWPARLDMVLGELGRYRDTLMRRISDRALDKLMPVREPSDAAHPSA